jgi:hypothetical protein
MKAVASLTRGGHFKDAFEVLGERVVSSGADFREAAARKWLELSAEDREKTALYASGAGHARISMRWCRMGSRPKAVCAVKALPFASGKRQSHPRRNALCQQLPERPGSGGDWPRPPRRA